MTSTSTAPALGLTLLAGAPGAPALVVEGRTLTYAELRDRVARRRSSLGEVRRLVMVAARNALEPVVTYLAALEGGHPVLLVPADDSEATRRHRASLIDRFDPDVIAEDAAEGWILRERRPGSRHEFHPELAVLASTSGSTGSPKLVRLSGRTSGATPPRLPST